MVVKAGEA